MDKPMAGVLWHRDQKLCDARVSLELHRRDTTPNRQSDSDTIVMTTEVQVEPEHLSRVNMLLRETPLELKLTVGPRTIPLVSRRVRLGATEGPSSRRSQ